MCAVVLGVLYSLVISNGKRPLHTDQHHHPAPDRRRTYFIYHIHTSLWSLSSLDGSVFSLVSQPSKHAHAQLTCVDLRIADMNYEPYFMWRARAPRFDTLLPIRYTRVPEWECEILHVKKKRSERIDSFSRTVRPFIFSLDRRKRN